MADTSWVGYCSTYTVEEDMETFAWAEEELPLPPLLPFQLSKRTLDSYRDIERVLQTFCSSANLANSVNVLFSVAFN